jgi:hypothetical protein
LFLFLDALSPYMATRIRSVVSTWKCCLYKV